MVAGVESYKAEPLCKVVMIEIGVVNAYLDVAVKLMVLILGSYLLLLLRSLNSFVESAERSAESVEHTAETVEKTLNWSKLLPFTGGKK